MFYGIIALCGILSFLGVRSNYYPLKWTAGFGWLALLLYWINADLLVDGSPADITITLLLIMLFLLFLLWGMAGRKGTFDVEDEISSTGSLVRRIVRSTKQGNNNELAGKKGEGTLEYRNTVRKALNRGKKINRR